MSERKAIRLYKRKKYLLRLFHGMETDFVPEQIFGNFSSIPSLLILIEFSLECFSQYCIQTVVPVQLFFSPKRAGTILQIIDIFYCVTFLTSPSHLIERSFLRNINK